MWIVYESVNYYYIGKIFRWYCQDRVVYDLSSLFTLLLYILWVKHFTKLKLFFYRHHSTRKVQLIMSTQKLQTIMLSFEFLVLNVVKIKRVFLQLTWVL